MEVKGDLNIDGTLTVNNAPVTGGSGITVQEADGSPNVSSVTTVKVSNGTLTDNGGGTVTITTGGGGGSITIGETDSNPPDFTSADTLLFDSRQFYLSPSSAGKPIVSIRPSGILTAGSVPYTAFDTSARDVTSHYLLGSTIAETTFTVASNGATITATWTDASPSEGINIIFGTGVIAAAGAGASLTATLTAGTDASPQMNFLYVLETTPTTLTVSTTSFPDETTSHCRVGKVLCQSAASMQTQTAYMVHGYNDRVHSHNPAGTGTANHVTRWVREQPATWFSGVAATGTINTGPTPDTVTFSTTSGTVYTLRTQTFPAFTDPATVYVVNKNSGAYTPVTTMPGETSSGTAIGGGDRINVVLWGAVSPNSGDCKLFLNLPSGYYPSNNAALADASRFTNYNIPAQFRGEGFLIAMFTYQYTTAAGGTYTLVAQTDLRGQSPSVNGGGAGGSATEFSDSTFKILDNLDETKIIQFQASGITTGTTRTLTAQDRDGTIALTDQLNGFYYLTVRDIDLSPAVAARTLEFTNGTVSDQGGGVARVTIASSVTGATASNFSSALEWQFTHNLGTSDIIFSLFDDQGEMILPDKAAVHNPNIAYFYFTEAVAGRAVVAGGTTAGTGISVSEIDGSPNIGNVSTLQFTNGSVSDQGGGTARVTLLTGITVKDDVHTVSNATSVALNAGGFYLSNTSDGSPVINLRYDKDIYPIFVELGGAVNVATDPFCQYPYTIEYADYDCRSGSVSGGFYIIPAINPNGLGRRVGRGQPASGMDQLQINQTPKRANSTAGNRSVNPGDAVLFTLYGNASAKHVRVTLVCKKP